MLVVVMVELVTVGVRYHKECPRTRYTPPLAAHALHYQANRKPPAAAGAAGTAEPHPPTAAGQPAVAPSRASARWSMCVRACVHAGCAREDSRWLWWGGVACRRLLFSLLPCTSLSHMSRSFSCVRILPPGTRTHAQKNTLARTRTHTHVAS